MDVTECENSMLTTGTYPTFFAGLHASTGHNLTLAVHVVRIVATCITH